VGLGQETKMQSQVEIWQTLVQKPANSTWTGWRMRRKQLQAAFSYWKRRVQKSSVNVHLLVTKTCAIQDLSPRITKTCQNQTKSSVTRMNDIYLW
jgi:hypothetical protein